MTRTLVTTHDSLHDLSTYEGDARVSRARGAPHAALGLDGLRGRGGVGLAGGRAPLEHGASYRPDGHVLGS